MELDDVLKKRRSIRKYTEEEVNDLEIEMILKAGVLAPSAHNIQPWQVKILKKADILKITEMMDEWSSNHLLNEELKERARSVLITSTVMKKINTMFLILMDKSEKEDERTNNLLALGAFIQNMCLEATNLGKGTLWIRNTSIIDDKILTYFNLEEKEVVSFLALGCPTEEPAQRKRKDIKDILIL